MIQGTDLQKRYERYVEHKPGRAARLLKDLDHMLERKPDLVHERSQRDALLKAFNVRARCQNCGRELSKEASIARGQGAVCAKRIAEAERRRQAMA